MRSTFIKIFLSFWFAQILIAICTIFISIRQFEMVAVGYTSSFAMMQTLAKSSLQAYDAGGCQALKNVPNTFFLDKQGPSDQPAVLLDSHDHPLCQQIDIGVLSDAVLKIRKNGYMLGERHGPGYVLGMQVKDAHGRNYVYLVRGTFPTEMYFPFQEMLPRLVIGIVISILVTFGITLVFTRPIGSLRNAARQLAAGNLTARAKSSGHKAGNQSGDELHGLVYDFNVMAERLESLVDSHKLLLRDVSHELRSPLARLSVALEWAREEAQPGIEDQLERMESEVVRLNALIGQLLSLSHLESASKLTASQKFSVSGIVEEILPDMEYEARSRNCTVNFSNTAASECAILGSPELLGRAIENVVRNAIAYTQEGTAVEIALGSQSKSGQRVVTLRIEDRGPGVPEAALRSIFHPFFRLDSSRRRSTGGFGVGLAIAERAVQLHGGTIVARNAAGGGLAIEICLPPAEE